ncbi:MAG TPA: hypothetical protein VLJ38_19205 [Polyangiaceae bacterium]|nr:hypothetical protein [Polyangiaceae bacterium]
MAAKPEPAAATAPAAAAPAKSDADADADAEAAAAAAAAAAGGGGSESAASDSEFKLNLYGFSDFTYSTTFGRFDYAQTHSSFAVGKLNLYAGADLGDNWRALSEIRFMYLPNGTTPLVGANGSAPTRIDTTVADYTDLGRPVRWGGISIERAWLEHTFHPAFTLRVGQFLTPYGIWNVDHGSPVIIGVRRPFIVGEALLPEHQTGLEAYGSFNFGPSQIGYHLTLSNGRGPIDTYQDLDHNKAVGGRVFFKHDASFGTLTIGASAYKGSYTDAHSEYGVSPAGDLVINNAVVQAYDELALAADVKWELGGLLVQSEAIMNDTAYNEPGRPTTFAFDGGPPGFMPDARRWGVYALAGYRTPLFGIMPFFGGEYYETGTHAFTPPAAAVWGGLNSRPTARVVLKAQFTHSWFNGKFPGKDPGHFNGLDLQAAWSF